MRNMEGNRLPAWTRIRALGDRRRWNVTDDDIDDEIKNVHERIEAILLTKGPLYHRRFVCDAVALVFHAPENMIQVETLKHWSDGIQNKIEDAIRDVAQDYESEIIFTFVAKKGARK